jgi:hypothetical protein
MPRQSRKISLTTSVALVLAIFDSGVMSYQTSSSLLHHHRTINNVRLKPATIFSLGWQQQRQQQQHSSSSSSSALHIFGNKDKESSPAPEPSAEETAKKYGLEAGLFQSLKSDNSGTTAKSLLAKYGIAYLATSIPLALLSFAICYTLVDNGVDVTGLLAKVGINNVGDAGEKAGTFAIAYAAHKAASPIRFPPTVLLTPIVARIIGKEEAEDDGSV